MSRRTGLIVALGFALTAGGACAAGNPAAANKAVVLGKQQYETEKQRIDAQLRADRRYCDGLQVARPWREVCEVQARGKAESLKAELEARYQRTPEASLQAKTTKANANFDVARAKCRTQKGKAKDRCVDQARAAREAAIRQARVEKVDETGGIFGPGAGKNGRPGAS